MDGKQRFDLSQRKTEALRLTNELHLGQIRLGVQAIPTSRARRPWKEPASFVEENRLRVHAGARRELANPHPKIVNPIPRYGVNWVNAPAWWRP